MKIWLKHLPYVERLYRLAINIYIVREMKLYEVEEHLYSKLAFVYRSSSVMIKVTRFPNDRIRDDNLEELD